jgi:hypothetical protein
MRVPVLPSPRGPLRRTTALTLFSLALAAGLAACQSANPAEPGNDVSMDPAPITLQRHAGPAAALSLPAPTPIVLHPICRILRRPVGTLAPRAGDIRVCATGVTGDVR